VIFQFVTLLLLLEDKNLFFFFAVFVVGILKMFIDTAV